MINQLIRKYIKNYAVQLTESSLLSEADKKWEAPYILAYNTRIGAKVDSAARAAGAITGLPIIFKRTKKGTYSDSELDELVKQVFAKAAEQYFPVKYNPKTRLFIYFQALDKTNKKVWNVWAIDKDKTGINQLSKEIKQALQKTTYFAQSEQQIDKIQSVTLMNLDQANKWFTYLQDSGKKFNLSTTLNLPKLDKIKIDVVGDDVQADLASKEVIIKNRMEPAIDDDGVPVTDDDGNTINVDTGKYDVYDTNNNLLHSDVNSNGFEGEAKMSVSTDGESLTFQPIFGTKNIREVRTKREGAFYGEFKNGAPYKGEVEYYSATDDQFKTFEGEVESTVYTRSSGQQGFEFKKITGRGTYGNGMIFDGEFKDNVLWNGTVFNKNKQQIGQFIDGEYKRGILYPKDLEIDVDDIDGNNKKLKVYKLNDNLYVYDIVGKYWGKVVDVSKFENEDLYNLDVSIFDNIVSVTDAATIKKLNNKFIPNADDNLIPGPEEPPAPEPAPNPPAKKKYVVFTSNTANIYELEGSQFVLTWPKQPTTLKCRTTGYPLLGTKTAKIKGGSSTQYKMYKAEISKQLVYVPERFVKIVER